MSSWDEISSYLRTEYDATERDGNIALVFTWENEDRSQALSVSTYEDSGVHWMSIVSGVCKEGELAHRDALERNSQLPVGGLILVDGSYLLSYAVPLALVNETTVIDDLLLYVAAAADTLESEIAGTDEN
jgi:hypothetical protein